MSDTTYDQTIEARKIELKQSLIEQFKETPIMTVACRKVGISRATYYRWRNEDCEFANASNVAIKEGINFINDLSELQIIQLIKEKRLPAIALWLKHNSPKYGGKNMSGRLPVSPEPLTEDEEKLFKKALGIK